MRTPEPSKEDAPPSNPATRPPLAQRLEQMSDHQLVAYQMTATRIITDAEHPKRAMALRALPKIEKELARRAAAMGAAPVAAPVQDGPE